MVNSDILRQSGPAPDPDGLVIGWTGDSLRFIDQTLLPREVRVVETREYRDVVDAIRHLALRGAPLIGIAAAYGVALAAREADETDPGAYQERIERVIGEFAATRPTAVNLFWALGRMREALDEAATVADAREALLRAALAIHADDTARCRAIGVHGAAVIPHGAGIVTHCNTGALATGGEGTAFSVLLAAHRAGGGIHVYADETRPLLQGARLTMWELQRHGIPATLITDGSAAALMRAGLIDIVITGADRIAANGDTANKIGTYALAVAAHHHGIPFYVAAPLSTVDMDIEDGGDIPIEQRDGDEIAVFNNLRIAPEGADVFAPAFDVTPHALITGLITERGIVRDPFGTGLRAVCADGPG